MKKALASLILFVLCSAVLAQDGSVFDLTGYGVRIEPDKRLIAVLSTLEIAGVQTQLAPEGEALRQRIRKNAKDISPDLRQKIEIFVNQYKKRHPETREAEIAAPFISMAYALTPAPELAEPFRSVDLPDDLLEVLDFSVLVREFYRSPGVAGEIDSIFKDYQELGDKLRPSAREMVTDVLDYLHTRPELTYIERIKVESKKGRETITTYEPRERERTFTIVPEMLNSKGTINFLNITDDYYAIVPPDTDLSSSEVRRGFLQFVLDPLVLQTSKEIREKQDAFRALVSARREAGGKVSADPYLTISRSLVAAVDAREEQFRKEKIATAQARSKIPLMKTDEEKQQVVAELDRVKGLLSDEAAMQLSDSYEQGAVFCFYFAEKLRGIEESGFDIASSLKDWIISLDPEKENGRLETVVAARKRAMEERAKGKTSLVIETTLVENPLTTKLLDIDKLADSGKFVEAEAALKVLLEEAPTESPRIYYALGRLSSRSAEGIKEADELNYRLIKAKTFYENVLRSASPSTDPGLLSSTYFALGRIYEYYKQPEYAVKIYDAALKLGKVEGGAFEEAFEAKKKLVGNN
jgi:tetratricopeptide (TPR) repeat protein